MTLQYRHPTEADISSITSIINRSRKETLYHRDMTSDEINIEIFEDQNYDADGAWIVFDGDQAIAYGAGIVEKEKLAEGKSDGVIEIDIIPQARASDASHRLMEFTVGYLRQQGAAIAAARAEDVTESWKKELYLNHGFKCVRQIYRMALHNPSTIPPKRLPPGITIEHKMMKDMTDDEMTRFSDAFNDMFTGVFEFWPDPASKWIRWRDICEDPWRISLAMESSNIVAFCISEDSQAYNKEHGTRVGWINFLGVSRQLRGKGIGSAMLADGISWIKGLGHDHIMLGVDAENANALGLYESLGFVVENKNEAFHLAL